MAVLGSRRPCVCGLHICVPMCCGGDSVAPSQAGGPPAGGPWVQGLRTLVCRQRARKRPSPNGAGPSEISELASPCCCILWARALSPQEHSRAKPPRSHRLQGPGPEHPPGPEKRAALLLLSPAPTPPQSPGARALCSVPGRAGSDLGQRLSQLPLRGQQAAGRGGGGTGAGG